MGGLNVKALAKQLGYNFFVDGCSLKSKTAQIILSDFFLQEPDDLDFDPSTNGDAAIGAIADIYGKRVFLSGVHMRTLSPLLRKNLNDDFSLVRLAKVTFDEVFRKTEHLKSAIRFLTWINNKTWYAAVIGGDFNTIFMARSIRLMTRDFNDSLWPCKDFFIGTKKSKYALPISPRIDYLFHSENVLVKFKAVLSKRIGDHLPVIACYAICGSSI